MKGFIILVTQSSLSVQSMPRKRLHASSFSIIQIIVREKFLLWIFLSERLQIKLYRFNLIFVFSYSISFFFISVWGKSDEMRMKIFEREYEQEYLKQNKI